MGGILGILLTLYYPDNDNKTVQAKDGINWEIMRLNAKHKTSTNMFILWYKNEKPATTWE